MSLLLAVEETASTPFPTFVFGAIAMGIFLLLGYITFTYRDVANRHEHKSNDSAGHH